LSTAMTLAGLTVLRIWAKFRRMDPNPTSNWTLAGTLEGGNLLVGITVP
jgi:hypothetical protein